LRALVRSAGEEVGVDGRDGDLARVAGGGGQQRAGRVTRLQRFFTDRPARQNARADRATLLRRAIQLSALSVGWNGIAGALAFVLAVASGSLSLLGFGVDAVIDSVASLALIWRFHEERRNPERAARIEHLAERIVGGVLLAAALALSVGAVRSLLAHSEVETATGVLALLVASMIALPPLAIAKRRVAADLQSGALRADALLTGAAAILASISLLGVVASTLLGLWWADGAGALVIAAFLAREGWTSVRLSEGAELEL
jgi:divalent metal cation (Fe/Co/Zn/Cd) transporter